MPVHFHKQALELLGIAYEPDADAMAALAARGEALGIELPASFVEWYGMRNGIALLKRHSNCDEPIEIAKLGMRSRGRSTADTPLLLEFMDENQGVCTWAIQLDDGDDPPVYVAVDRDFVWQPCADRFSTFITCQMWDYGRVLVNAGGVIAAQGDELSPGDLERLRRTFTARATTHGWPTPDVYRFERDDARVLIWPGSWQTDWWISAGSEAALADLARELWRTSGRHYLIYGIDEPGERVVDQLREEP